MGSPAYSRTCPTRAVDADPADRAEDDVLRRDAERKLARVEDAHRLRLEPRKALCGEHVLDLGRPDTECERAERAVRRRVAVAADDGHARLREPELGADDVDDALAAAARRVERDAEFRQLSRSASSCGGRAGRAPVRIRRDVVIHRREREVGAADEPAGEPQPLERLGEVTSWMRWRST